MSVTQDQFEEKLLTICRNDPRYHKEAYIMVFEALDAWNKSSTQKHITTEQLPHVYRCTGYAVFGLLAPDVLRRWGLRTDRDLGNIVYNLIGAKLLIKQENDKIEDFSDSVNMIDESRTLCEELFSNNSKE